MSVLAITQPCSTCNPVNQSMSSARYMSGTVKHLNFIAHTVCIYAETGCKLKTWKCVNFSKYWRLHVLGVLQGYRWCTHFFGYDTVSLGDWFVACWDSVVVLKGQEPVTELYGIIYQKNVCLYWGLNLHYSTLSI